MKLLGAQASAEASPPPEGHVGPAPRSSCADPSPAWITERLDAT